MPLIDQYLNYVESYTKLSKTTTLLLLSHQPLSIDSTLYQHLYAFGKGPTIYSIANNLSTIEFQWSRAQIINATSEIRARP